MSPPAGSGVEHWVREEVRALAAYHVPSAAGLIKLDAMENPYTWPEALIGEWLECLRGVAVNRYPDPGAEALTARLRAVLGIPGGAGVLLGNGSDELIQLLALALGGPQRCVLSPDPSFVMYRMTALAARMGYEGVALAADDFALDAPAMLAAIERHRPAVVYLAYPNNPTGNAFAPEAVEAVLEAAPGLVVIDEAYAPFAEASYLPQAGERPNLLVMRTLSKVGLAGLRLGLVAGPADWLAELDKLRLPYNINVLTQATADFALRHYGVFEEQTAQIRRERARVYAALAALDGVRAWPSEANFILFRVGPGRAVEVRDGLRARGVLIKSMHGAHPLLADCLRVTVGTRAENDAFLAALAATL